MSSIITKTDSYKVSHYRQYPPGTENVYSYFESRGGDFDETIFFGLQYIIKKHLLNPITQEDIDKAEKLFEGHFGTADLFNRAGWERLLEKYTGALPVSIKAVPEGTKVPTGNVLMTIENTDPEFYWLTNYLETLLVQVWYPSTIATNSLAAKNIIKNFMRSTGDNIDGLEFKLHDFGFRGVTSHEQAGIGGASHLLNFLGTDTVAGLEVLIDYYNADSAAGFSIPAAEHSTITSWGRDRELDAFDNMLTQYPTGLVAVVSDSFNIFEACRAWGSDRFRERILNRDGGLVIRPDSGDPPEVVVEVLDILESNFGSKTNSKGFKELPPQIRVIQGDGIDRAMIRKILAHMAINGWAATNVAFGSGGGLLQKFDRDTSKYAFKCSAINVDGIWNEDISKDPITDHGKKSKAGKLSLVNIGEVLTTVKGEHPDNLLQEVYRNGTLLIDQSLDEIRERIAG